MIYLDNEYILHAEYREVFKNSELMTDFSLNRNENETNLHFFANLSGELSNNTNYDLKVENVNNNNYLKIHDIKSYTPFIKNDSVLTSFLKVELP